MSHSISAFRLWCLLILLGPNAVCRDVFLACSLLRVQKVNAWCCTPFCFHESTC